MRKDRIGVKPGFCCNGQGTKGVHKIMKLLLFFLRHTVFLIGD